MATLKQLKKSEDSRIRPLLCATCWGGTYLLVVLLPLLLAFSFARGLLSFERTLLLAFAYERERQCQAARQDPKYSQVAKLFPLILFACISFVLNSNCLSPQLRPTSHAEPEQKSPENVTRERQQKGLAAKTHPRRSKITKPMRDRSRDKPKAPQNKRKEG